MTTKIAGSDSLNLARLPFIDCPSYKRMRLGPCPSQRTYTGYSAFSDLGGQVEGGARPSA